MTEPIKIVIPQEMMDAINQTHQRQQKKYEESMAQVAENVDTTKDVVSLRLPTMTVVTTAEDVTALMLTACYELYENRFQEQEIDWMRFWDDLESRYNISIGSDIESGAARLIQKEVRIFSRC